MVRFRVKTTLFRIGNKSTFFFIEVNCLRRGWYATVYITGKRDRDRDRVRQRQRETEGKRDTQRDTERAHEVI